ncbi:MAG: hypothetical protein GC200_02030 [Tepidisphaera sp.]|nr:hypothetical protein [Tepidisphaera sp.]
MPQRWFDAHLDLAYLAVRGRPMTKALAALEGSAAGPDAPPAVTLPALLDGEVRMCLATIFTEVVEAEADGLLAEQYIAGDAEGAHRRGRAQLEAYLTWADQGHIAIDLPQALHPPEGVGEIRGGMGVSELVPPSVDSIVGPLLRDDRIHVGILMENADPIRTPEELPWWVERGVCAIGLAWARPSRYAAGNNVPPEAREGITSIGRDLVREIDRLNVVHDASHLSDRSLDDLFAMTSRPVIASHSNCRALLDRPGGIVTQRHLTDRAIREIAGRGGIIGINLFSAFLNRHGKDRRATLVDVLAHIDRICELVGDTRHVGLGSDMDGGFSRERLPAGIDSPRDLRVLSDALRRHGWNDDQIEDFAWRNWARFWSKAGPRL